MIKTKITSTPFTEPDFIIGIDPSSGAKSAVGACIIKPSTREIIDVNETICPKYMSVEQRIKLINKDLKNFLYPRYTKGNILIAIEFTVMAGKGGESLNRAIGAIIAATPIDQDGAVYRNVQNTTVKKLVAGTGKAEKEDVAYGLLNFFSSNKDACNIINNLTVLGKYDILDAIAIAVTGYIQYKTGEAQPGKSRPNNRMK